MNLDLHDSIHKIFEKVKLLTRKDVNLIEKRDLNVYAFVKIARESMAHHLIYYKPEHTGIMNHLIAHECGHILRIYGVEPESRLVPFTNDQLKLQALKDIEPEIQELSRMLPFEGLVEVANLWYAGLIRQLTSYPSDIMIEKWIHDEYPDLRPYQSKSMKKQYDEAVQGLSNRVERMTPHRILQASNGMNYAFFHILEAHFNDNYHLGRYDRSAYAKTGRSLIEVQQEAPNDYTGDMIVTRKWAQMLSVDDWFSWRDFEDIPDNYQNTF